MKFSIPLNLKFSIPLNQIRWKREETSLLIKMFFAQCILLCPDVFSHTFFYRYIRWMQTGLCLISLVIILSRYLSNKYIWANLLFFTILTIATIRVGLDFESLLLYSSRAIGIVVLYYYVSHKNYLLFWKGASDYFFLMGLLNTILTILYPGGLLFDVTANGKNKGYYLLGNTSQVIPFYIISIAIAIMYYRQTGEKKSRPGFIYLQALICDLIYGSMTSLVMLFIFLLLHLILQNNKPTIKKGKKLAFLAIVFVFLWYYALLVLNVQVLFRLIIEKVLHKDVTLSTRVVIWNRAFQLIKKSLLLGYGASTRRLIVFGSRSFDAHNTVLQIMLMGGILLLASYIWIIVIAFKNWTKCKSQMKMTGLVLFIAFAIGASAEMYVFTYIFLIPLIIYLIGEKQDNPAISI